MAPFHVLWPLSLRLYRSRPAAGDSAAKSRWPHCSPDHGRSHVHFPSTHIPLREHPRSDLQGPRGSGGAGWGGGEGGRGAGGDGGVAQLAVHPEALPMHVTPIGLAASHQLAGMQLDLLLATRLLVYMQGWSHHLPGQRSSVPAVQLAQPLPDSAGQDAPLDAARAPNRLAVENQRATRPARARILRNAVPEPRLAQCPSPEQRDRQPVTRSTAPRSGTLPRRLALEYCKS